MSQAATTDRFPDAVVDPDDLTGCLNRLDAFAARYAPCFPRAEHRRHARAALRGRLSDLPRKTSEPIARREGVDRRPLQLFLGAGAWDDRPVRHELRRHVGQQIGDPAAVFLLDGSGFPKKGDHSCGVARQWCGRLGKIDNCQVGVFLAYASRHGRALLDATLYLTETRAADAAHRAETGVPEAVPFREKWRLNLDQLDRVGPELPGRWVVGDDEYGRCSELRAALRDAESRGRDWVYVLDVPANTRVRDPFERRPPAGPGGKPRVAEFEPAAAWAARQRKGRWRRVRLPGGTKGPREADVLMATVEATEGGGRVGVRERLVVIRTCEAKPQTWYALSNAFDAGRKELACVHGRRHGIEELLGEGKGEVGLGEYEVRGWVGWQHHMTMSLLALWFVQLEKRELGKKNAGDDGGSGAVDPVGVDAGRAERGGRGAGGGGGVGSERGDAGECVAEGDGRSAAGAAADPEVAA